MKDTKNNVALVCKYWKTRYYIYCVYITYTCKSYKYIYMYIYMDRFTHTHTYIFVHMKRFCSAIVKYDLEKSIPNSVTKGASSANRGRK